MSISLKHLQSIAQLAYLDTNLEDMTKLTEEVDAIIDFVQQLSQVDTERVLPLFHPMDLYQPLRADEVTEASCLKELAELAPYFEEQFYMVPQVIEVNK